MPFLRHTITNYYCASFEKYTMMFSHCHKMSLIYYHITPPATSLGTTSDNYTNSFGFKFVFELNNILNEFHSLSSEDVHMVLYIVYVYK